MRAIFSILFYVNSTPEIQTRLDYRTPSLSYLYTYRRKHSSIFYSFGVIPYISPPLRPPRSTKTCTLRERFAVTSRRTYFCVCEQTNKIYRRNRSPLTRLVYFCLYTYRIFHIYSTISKTS